MRKDIFPTKNILGEQSKRRLVHKVPRSKTYCGPSASLDFPKSKTCQVQANTRPGQSRPVHVHASLCPGRSMSRPF